MSGVRKCCIEPFPWHNQDSNSGPPDPEAKSLPLNHNAIQDTSDSFNQGKFAIDIFLIRIFVSLKFLISAITNIIPHKYFADNL